MTENAVCRNRARQNAQPFQHFNQMNQWQTRCLAFHWVICSKISKQACACKTAHNCKESRHRPLLSGWGWCWWWAIAKKEGTGYCWVVCVHRFLLFRFDIVGKRHGRQSTPANIFSIQIYKSFKQHAGPPKLTHITHATLNRGGQTC